MSLCNEVLYSHELNSASSRIQTGDLMIQSVSLTLQLNIKVVSILFVLFLHDNMFWVLTTPLGEIRKISTLFGWEKIP